MEEEVKKGIAKFEAALKAEFPSIQLVIPTRPTGGAYLVSFTFEGMRVYGTLPEDALADWGEEIPESKAEFEKLRDEISKKMKSALA